MIADVDRQVIIDTIGTFGIDAPIILDDIRFAAAVDGRPLNHITSVEMCSVMRERCVSVIGPCGAHDRVSWVRLWRRSLLST